MPFRFLLYLRPTSALPTRRHLDLRRLNAAASNEVFMKMEAHGDTLRITGLTELDATNSTDVTGRIRAALHASQKHIELDLSQTTYLDSCGLGALIALHKTACSRAGAVRLINPLPAVQEVLKLTRLGRIFEIVKG